MRRLGGVGGGLARAWLLVVLVPLLWDLRASAAAPQRLAASSLSPLRGTITDVGRADPNRRHSAVVGLVPRNPEALEAFLATSRTRRHLAIASSLRQTRSTRSTPPRRPR